MSYKITGINPGQFEEGETKTETVRVIATHKSGFPCRVTLEDADEGEELLLFNYVSHDVTSPYRSSYAVYAKVDAKEPAQFNDEVPPVFEGRPLGMRAFGTDAMLKTASLSMPGAADKTIRQLFELDEIAYIDVHNAAHGCFVARVERSHS